MAKRSIFQLFVDVRANVATFQKDMQKASRSLQRMERSATRLGSTLSRNLSLPLALVAGAALKMAADAEESENLFKVAMGDMEDEAREFSETLADSLGVNRFELRKMIGTTNLMLKTMGIAADVAFDMSKGIAQLTQDMASLRNLRAEEVFKKITSGLAGEAEALKLQAIFIDESTVKQTLMTKGLIKQGQELTNQQKVLGRYIALIEQTVLDQGDMAATSESATNMFRRLLSQMQETAIGLGNQLLPAFAKVLRGVLGLVGGIRDLIDWFGKLPQPIRLTVGGILLFATIIGPTIIGVAKLAGAIRVLGIAMASSVNPIVGIAVALATIAAIAGVIALTGKDAERAAVDVEAWQIEVDKAAAAFLKFGAAGGKGPADIFKDLADKLDLINKRFRVFGSLGTEGAERITAYKQAIEDLIAAGVDPLNQRLQSLRQTWLELSESLATVTGFMKEYEDEQARLQRQAERLGDTLQASLISALVTVSESLGNLLANLKGGFRDFLGSIVGFLGTTLQQLGKTLIAFGIAGNAIKNFITNPVGALVAGAALVALGAALSAAASNIVSAGGNTLAGAGGAAPAPVAPTLGGDLGNGPGGPPIIINFDPADGVVIMNPDNPRSLERWIEMFEAVSGQRYVARPSGGQIQFLPRGA